MRHFLPLAWFGCLGLTLVGVTGCDGDSSAQSARREVVETASAAPATSPSTPAEDEKPESPSVALVTRIAQSKNPTDAPTLRARKRATNLRAGGLRDITFDDLEFGIERDGDFQPEMLTDAIRELEGKKVILRGFILASSIFQQTGIEQFVLVRDNQECCFGPGAYIYHNVQVEMVSGRTADFSIRPVTVEGVFSIRPWVAEGKCYSVFHIEAERVK